MAFRNPITFFANIFVMRSLGLRRCFLSIDFLFSPVSVIKMMTFRLQTMNSTKTESRPCCVDPSNVFAIAGYIPAPALAEMKSWSAGCRRVRGFRDFPSWIRVAHRGTEHVFAGETYSPAGATVAGDKPQRYIVRGGVGWWVRATSPPGFRLSRERLTRRPARPWLGTSHSATIPSPHPLDSGPVSGYGACF